MTLCPALLSKIIVISMFLGLAVSLNRIWRVSRTDRLSDDVTVTWSSITSDGTNKAEDTPCVECGSLDHVTSLAEDGDVVEIDGRRRDVIYSLCHWSMTSSSALGGDDDSRKNVKSITIRGFNGRPRLTCVEPETEKSLRDDVDNENNFVSDYKVDVSKNARNGSSAHGEQALDWARGMRGHFPSAAPNRRRKSVGSRKCRIEWNNVEWFDVYLLLAADCEVIIGDSLFVGTIVVVEPGCDWISVTISRTVFSDDYDDDDGIFPASSSCTECVQSVHPGRNESATGVGRRRLRRGTENMVDATDAVMLSCLTSVTLLVEDSDLKHTTLVVENRRRTFIRVTRTRFTADRHPMTSYLSGLRLTLGEVNANVEIVDCVFSNRKHSTVARAAVNFFEAALWIKSQYSSTIDSPDVYVQLRVTRCSFNDNERGLTLIGQFQRVNITDCIFTNHRAVHAGAGLLLMLSENKNSQALVMNCSFHGNVAGLLTRPSVVNALVPVGKDSETEEGSTYNKRTGEIKLDMSCCRGAVTPVGKGGAVRVMSGTVDLVDCRFVNNTASSLGGSIFVDMKAKVTASRVHFETSPASSDDDISDHEQPTALQGDVIYSDGLLKLDEVKLVIRRARDGVSVLRHSGPVRLSINVTAIQAHCPPGFDLRATNSTSYRVHKEGLLSFYELDQLAYFCESCPLHRYSLDAGWLQYDRPSTANCSTPPCGYYTLLINKSSPSTDYSRSHKHHKIMCSDCPYGGRCIKGAVLALPNFWGYVVTEQLKANVTASGGSRSSEVLFQRCPIGYCCPAEVDSHCSAYDTCAEGRRGCLCGRCNDGLTEAIHSTRCLPNITCSSGAPVSLWVAALGLTYAVLLVGAALVPAYGCIWRRDVITPGCHDDEREGDEDEVAKNFGQLRTSCSSSVTVTWLILLVYYYQDIQIMTSFKSSIFDTIDIFNVTEFYIDQTLSALLEFNTNPFDVSRDWCVTSFGAVENLVIRTGAVTYALFILAAALIIGALLRRACCRPNDDVIAGINSVADSAGGAIGSEMVKAGVAKTSSELTANHFVMSLFTSGFILGLLFAQQRLVRTAFQMIYCVKVDGKSVLYIDGEITCYRPWQYAIFAFIVCCLAPLCIVLAIGPGFLQRRTISTCQFFTACAAPLPTLVAWFIRWVSGRRQSKRRQKRGSSSASNYSNRRAPSEYRDLRLPDRLAMTSSPSYDVTLHVLLEPYRNDMLVSWSGVQLGLRQVLAVLYVSIDDNVARQMALSFTCFVAMMLHVERRPYRKSINNVVGSIALAGLFIIATVELVRAAFVSAGYRADGPNAVLEKVFAGLETVVGRLLPALGLVVVLARVVCYVCGCRSRTGR